MATDPSRIDLLELDIDLRLADLWREAVDVSDWSLEIVAAFIRAAYGKGYCDALTEESPGSLCVDHGYRMPDRRSPRSPGSRVGLRRAGCVSACSGPSARPRLDSPRGSERESGAARDRALGGGGARRVPAVHVDRGWRESVARSQRARRPHGRGSARRCRGRTCARRRARRGPSLRAEGHRARRRRRPSPSGTRDPFPISSRSGGTSWSTASFAAASFVAEPGSMITKCPSKYAPKQSGDSA